MNLSDLTIKNTFVYYDGPALFSAIDNDGQNYVAVLVEEDTYLYTPVTKETLQKTIDKELSLREAFQSSPFVWKVLSTFDPERIELSQVPEEWFPLPGLYL